MILKLSNKAELSYEDRQDHLNTILIKPYLWLGAIKYEEIFEIVRSALINAKERKRQKELEETRG